LEHIFERDKKKSIKQQQQTFVLTENANAHTDKSVTNKRMFILSLKTGLPAATAAGEQNLYRLKDGFQDRVIFICSGN
jgi:dTDP-D-glucose 4,6-dehydratase